MKRDETVYLRHILDAVTRIEEYTCGVDEQAFRNRTLIQDGVRPMQGEQILHVRELAPA